MQQVDVSPYVVGMEGCVVGMEGWGGPKGHMLLPTIINNMCMS